MVSKIDAGVNQGKKKKRHCHIKNNCRNSCKNKKQMKTIMYSCWSKYSIIKVVMMVSDSKVKKKMCKELLKFHGFH